jgi:hypothetical protein
MVVLLDKRYAKRHSCDGEIIWSYFNKKDWFIRLKRTSLREDRRF